MGRRAKGGLSAGCLAKKGQTHAGLHVPILAGPCCLINSTCCCPSWRPPAQVADPFLAECEAFGYQGLQAHQEAVLCEAQGLVAALERKEAAVRRASRQ